MKPNTTRPSRWWLAIGLALVAGAPAQDGCVACHASAGLFVKERSLYNYYQDWIQSPHRAAGLGCADCHGGDPSADEASAAHGESLPLSDPASPLYYQNQPATCGTCHADKLERFETSKHYKALFADATAPTCTTCHRAMNRRPYYREILVSGCQTCHNEQNLERLPLVAERAGQAFRRLNIAKGYLGWLRKFYASQGWPGDSRQRFAAIDAKYERAVSGVHGFGLEDMDASAGAVLDEIKATYDRARAQKETQ